MGNMPPIPRGCDRVDMWGAGYKDFTGTYQHALHLPFAEIKTLEDVENYPWPVVGDFDFSSIAEECKAASSFVRVCGHNAICDIMNAVGYRGRGGEQLIYDIMSNDDVGTAIIDRHIDFDYEYCKKTLEAGQGMFDVLQMGEDCGTQIGPLFSPKKFINFFAPRIKRFVDLAHHYGAVCKIHSCGSYRELIPIFIEEIGMDILGVQPEPAGMDPKELKRDFGDRVVFSEMLSIQNTLPTGSMEECKREAEDLVEAVGKEGGFIFGPPNRITLDIPIKNVLASYSAVLGEEIL
jgi:uroporphyrinogen decarboxylase